MWKRARKRLTSLLLAAMTVAALFPVQRNAQAVTGTVANLVIFLRFSDDTGTNNFQDAWPVISEIYDGSTFCFSDYIHTVSDGKLSVANVFPQHFSDADVAVLTLEHGAGYYTDSTQLVSEVVDHLEAALNPPLTAASVPNLQSVLPEATEINPTEPEPTEPDAPATNDEIIIAPPDDGAGTDGGNGVIIEPPTEDVPADGTPAEDPPPSGEVIISPAPPILYDTVLIDDPSEIPGTEQSPTEEPPTEQPLDNDTPTVPTEEILPEETEPEGGLVDAPLDAASVPQTFVAALGDGLTAGANADRFQFGTETLDHLQAGIVDNLTLIVQTSLDDEPYYPHRAVYPYSVDEYFTLNGTELHIGNYNVLNTGRLLHHYDDTAYSATNGWTANVMGGRGLVAHEFMHSLGFPDLYNYNSSIETLDGPVSGWDIMAQTSNYLQYPLSYFRAEQGWLDDGSDIVTLDNTNGTGTHTLNAVSEASGVRAYKIMSPLSTSEFFVVEYRYDPDGAGVPNPPQYECKVPESGLVVYRINNSIDQHTNAAGGLYTYVFRPDFSVRNSLDGTALNDAALNGTAGDPAETGLGTTTLADTYADGTIYFADGSNSGIAISNVAVNGTQLTFDLAFADYVGDASAWLPVGTGTVGSNALGVSLAVGGDGTVYAASEVRPDDTSSIYNVVIKSFDGGTWTTVETITNLNWPQLKMYNGSLYLIGARNDSQVLCYRLSSGKFTQIHANATGPLSALRFAEGAGLYAVLVRAGTFELLDLTSSASAAPSAAAPVTAGMMSTPAVCRMGDDLYVLFSDQLGSGGTVVKKYDNGAWTDIKSYPGKMSTLRLLTDGAKLYAFMAPTTPTSGTYTVFDGTTWSDGEDINGFGNLFDAQLLLANGVSYLSYVNTADSAGPVNILYRNGNGVWTQHGGGAFASSDATACAAAGNGNIYVAALSGYDAVVRYKAYAAASAPPATPTYTVRVERPAGYTDTTLWIDGIPYPGSLSGDILSVDLNGDATAKTVVMYSYKANGVPNGMYVWTLRYGNNTYTATAIPAFRDLLSYHGFSVRVTGKTGIRFKTGIVPTTRAKLIASSGLSGYRLVEYGTLSMFEREQSAYPMVKESDRTHVWLGRAYWTENGKTNDLIFETKDGRYRFTSVLVGIPQTEYGTNFAFRGYIVLAKDGRQITLYGPIVARSIRYVAQQVLNAHEFPAGSPADAFLRSIVQ